MISRLTIENDFKQKSLYEILIKLKVQIIIKTDQLKDSNTLKMNLTVFKRELATAGPSFSKKNNFEKNLKVFGSNNLTNGGGNSTTSEQLQLHDFIPLSLRTKDRIFEKCAPLYKKGMSLRDIEECTGISKCLITKSFLKNNLPIR